MSFRICPGISFPRRRIMIDKIRIAETSLQVIVDDPASLQMRIHRNRTQIPESTLFQILAHLI